MDAENLREARERRDQHEKPETPAEGTETPAADDTEAGDHAEDGHDPDRQAEQQVAVMGEGVAERTDPV